MIHTLLHSFLNFILIISFSLPELLLGLKHVTFKKGWGHNWWWLWLISQAIELYNIRSFIQEQVFLKLLKSLLSELSFTLFLYLSLNFLLLLLGLLFLFKFELLLSVVHVKLCLLFIICRLVWCFRQFLRWLLSCKARSHVCAQKRGYQFGSSSAYSMLGSIFLFTYLRLLVQLFDIVNVFYSELEVFVKVF